MIQAEIKKIIETAVKKLGNINMPPVSVEIPKDKTHGDYMTNISFELAKALKRSPNEIAALLKSQVEKNDIFKKVEVVGGFVNFFIKDEFFTENLKQILKEKEVFGKNDSLKNKKIVIEYTDTNILKEFHIGHLMSNTIGESLSRIFSFGGAKIKRACYQSDVGLHIAKAVWGRLQFADKSWQECYVLGSEKYDADGVIKKEIIDLNKKIFERSDKKINTIYDQGKKWSIEHFNSIYKKLGTHFDYTIFESQVAEMGKEIVQANVGNIFEKGENGALIFKGEKYGLHTRVFVNSEGLPTYEAKDLALAKFKYSKYSYDASVVITANEQNDYFKVMLCAMSQIFPELEKKTKHIGHGILRLPDGKMSSRTGKVVTFESLLDKVEELVEDKIKDRNFPEAQKGQIIESVAIGALKYSILKQSTGSDIIYDFEKSINFQGDSGPYLQYSLARAISVLQKAKQEKIKASLKKNPPEVSLVAKQMQYFSEVVQKAGKELQPHYVILYLTELASLFNSYYAQHKIVDTQDEFSPYKVALTEAFTIIMKNGLWLLGIPAPDKM